MVVGGQQDCFALVPPFRKKCLDVFNTLFIQAVQRFVHDQQFGALHEALLATGAPPAHRQGVFGYLLAFCLPQPKHNVPRKHSEVLRRSREKFLYGLIEKLFSSAVEMKVLLCYNSI